MTLRVSPWPRSIAWIKARPVTPVAVRERMDGLELRMGDRGLCEHRQVCPSRELHEVVDQLGHRLMVRWHEVCLVRTERGSADPDLLLTQASGDLRVEPAQKGLMHCEDRIGVDSVSEVERGAHRRHVADNLSGVAVLDTAELGQCDRLGT